MTYSSNLDSSVPTQGEAVRLGASRIRALTAAIRERLLTLFDDPDADPLTYKAGSIPFGAIKTLVTEYTYAVDVGAGILAFQSIPSTLPAGTPVIINWKNTSMPGTQFGPLILNAFHTGTELRWSVYNTGVGSASTNGQTIRLVSLIF